VTEIPAEEGPASDPGPHSPASGTIAATSVRWSLLAGRQERWNAGVDAQERFAELVEEFVAQPAVQPPVAGARGFGSTALKTGGSIFAMLTGERLVVKLPRERVAALIASGEGEPFDAGKGRPMKEWLTVADDEAWRALAEEARQFVEARRRRPTGRRWPRSR